MASLRADHCRYLREIREMSDERMAAAWADLMRRLFGD
jgi:hypothetical protein